MMIMKFIVKVSTANIDHRMIEYTLHQDIGEYKDFIVYFNASTNTIEVDVEEGFSLLCHSEKGKIVDNKLKVDGVCLAILAR